MGVSLSSCNLPGQRPSDNRIAPGRVELGLGIHGEPGAHIVPLPPVRELGATMMARLESALELRDGSPIAVLVNDLGGVPPIEMALATQAVLEAARAHEVRLVFGPARLMTSLDMKGFSVSVVSLRDQGTEDALRSPVGARAWPTARSYRPVAPVPLPGELRTTARVPSAHPGRLRVLEKVCEDLIELQGELDALDVRAGTRRDPGAVAVAAVLRSIASLTG